VDAEGGFGKIAEALATMFQELGGTTETGAEVTRVVVGNGRAGGIEPPMAAASPPMPSSGLRRERSS
jgi:phytoene dehydrogenase-like protein